MKKTQLFIMLVIIVLLAGCSEKTQDKLNELGESSKTDGEEETVNNVEASDDMTESASEDLTLQLLKVDEEDGITIDDNEIYQAIQAEIDSDPKMGVPNDFSLFPFDVVYFDDGGITLLFLAINRLDKPIRNMAFDLTLGNEDGDYIFADTEVDLPEDLIGTLEVDSAIPFYLDITEEDEELFYTLDQENVLLNMENFKIDFVE